ncbi:MAG: ABC transporter permease [Pirellulales bacterium]
MSLWKIAWRSLSQRSLSSTLTCLSMALGVALVVTVLLVYGIVQDSYNRNTSLGYHLVVGGKNGSKLDLVLSSVFYVSKSEYPIPYDYYKKFITAKDEHGHVVKGQYADLVQKAVPICLGDNYKGYRVVATTPEFFELRYGNDQTYEFAAGECFKADRFRDAVIGAEAARKTGLAVGSTFQPTHGITEEGPTHVHETDFHVVGLLAPTGTPNDRALFINMEGFYRLEGHVDPEEGTETAPTADHKDDHVVPDSQKKVTAILVLAGSDLLFGQEAITSIYAQELSGMINKGKEAQAASPVTHVTELLTLIVDPVMRVLLGIAILTTIVAGVGVMVGIYNTMSGRRHEIAVMRSLGASRPTVMLVVLNESLLLSVIGGLCGLLLGHAIVAAGSPLLVRYTGVVVNLLTYNPWEWVVLPALIILATVVGYLPALAAYRTDVVRGLAASQ